MHVVNFFLKTYNEKRNNAHLFLCIQFNIIITDYTCIVYDKNNSSFTPVVSSLVNIMSDGRIEYKTEGRQILIHVQVQIDIYTCKYCTCYCVH